jgi:hypothetical protein
MRITVSIFCVLLFTFSGLGQVRQKPKSTSSPNPQVSIQTATTREGRTVLLKSDGTWEYTNDPVVTPTPSVGVAQPALKALRVVAGATEVGISFEEYGRRMIDLKAEVDKAAGDLLDAELKGEIRASLQAYVDAGQAWNELTRGGYQLSRSFLNPDRQPFADALQKKYDIPTEILDPGAPTKPYRTMDGQLVLRTIWGAARKHLEKAETLAK